jgi:transposase-like protein
VRRRGGRAGARRGPCCLVAEQCRDPVGQAIVDYACGFERRMAPQAEGGWRMLQIHPDARTPPAVRAEIARSDEPSGTPARRYGVSSETIRTWRRRGPEDRLDHTARPHKLPWKATQEERAVVCACAGRPTSPSATSPSWSATCCPSSIAAASGASSAPKD